MALTEDLERFETLVGIVARLRGPGGCPWDREQTHRSLRPHVLAECYEVLEALDDGDSGKLCEELGDLLLLILLHARIADENGSFDIGDVIRGISEKVIRRHPHVFGEVKVHSAEEVLHRWDALKRQERNGESVLSGVPAEMPALAAAAEISRRAVRAGFEWENVEGVIDKLGEEIRELRKAAGAEEKSHEFGDLLFTLVNVARWEGIDAETALREANRKFVRRFRRMEELCRQRGLDFARLSMPEKDALWEEVKKETG
ncbi:MAG: nucleoside triphosphate pyrophosphohydrolase [Dehalococcoidales bacterium]|nr:nucleoside triphosphate pyrophosphohydrolase [Dehalococcoidales bacterium]